MSAVLNSNGARSRPSLTQLSPTALNNLAIRQLECGQFSNASRLLDMALNHTIELVKESRTSKNPLTQTETTRASTTPILMQRELICSWSTTLPIPFRPEENRTYIYARGLLINERHGKCSVDQQKAETSKLSKAIILYNAALATHTLAIEKVDSVMLRKAHTLYRVSRRVFVLSQRAAKNGGDKRNISHLHLHFLHMAILNNLGQLSHELAEFNLARNCFGQLEKHLAFLLVRKDQLHFFAKSDVRGMIANSAVQTPSTAPCA
jgi:hypothetical protein